MMRVRMKAEFTAAGPFGVAGPGQELEVPDAIARVLVERGYATPVEVEEPAAAPAVETAAFAPPERAVSRRGRPRRPAG